MIVFNLTFEFTDNYSVYFIFGMLALGLFAVAVTTVGVSRGGDVLRKQIAPYNAVKLERVR